MKLKLRQEQAAKKQAAKKQAAKKNGRGPVKVDSGFFTALADRIYDPRTRAHVRLCYGTLTNGIDPKTGCRMHCGLGELWYAMTGEHPGETLSEDDVIDEVVDATGVATVSTELRRGVYRTELERSLKNAGLVPLELQLELGSFIDTLVDLVEDGEVSCQDTAPTPLQRLCDTLESIPQVNDDVTYGSRWMKRGTKHPGRCLTPSEVYQRRARRVAGVLRQAAELLREYGL